jgi:hypothetical protein
MRGAISYDEIWDAFLTLTMTSWLDRAVIWLLAEHGRGSFMECTLTAMSMLTGLTLADGQWDTLPFSLWGYYWRGFPPWALAVPWLLAGSMTLVGKGAGRVHPEIGRRLRSGGMGGQLICLIAVVMMSISATFPHLSEMSAIHLALIPAALRTWALITLFRHR